MPLPFLHRMPLWMLGLLCALIFSVASAAGWAIGRRKARRQSIDSATGNDVLLGSLLALVGLVIAFTYGFTVNNYQNRRQVVISEANALSTAFNQADLFSEPGRTELRQALLDYARTRIVTAETAGTPALAREFIARTMRVQARIWPATVEVIKRDGPGPLGTSLVSNINLLLDLHSTRLASALEMLPQEVLLLIVFLVATALAVSSHDVSLSGRRSGLRVILFTLIMATVIFVVFDFDRTPGGFIRVNQNSIRMVIAGMESSL